MEATKILVSNCCSAADIGSIDGPKSSDLGRCPECFEGCEFIDENETCPECGEQRPGDERVEAGMKCSQCTYC